MAARYVYDFAEGHRDLADLLGGKGANLAEMTRLGLPVPPGFVITTEACRWYLRTGDVPDELWPQVRERLAALERRAGRRLGDPEDPLLVSVRSGARFSMPGMMETVLNIGLTDASVAGLARRFGDERLAWDSYRRLVHMFGTTVLGLPDEPFVEALRRAAPGGELDLDAAGLRSLVSAYRELLTEHAGRDFPQDPWEQLDLAVRAVFASWNTPRAVLYRGRERIPDDLGTAVSVVAMVFGNAGQDSGTGVAFTRDPATGRQGAYGDYLPNAQGEDVVAGVRTPVPLRELERLDPASYHQLLDVMSTLERHYRDLCDIEFTIERGRLWILQTRVGKRTAAAAFVVAAQLADEGLIDEDEALRRVSGARLAQLLFPRFDPGADRPRLATGINASPGAAVGEVVFDSATAVAAAERGRRVVLVRAETNPDDLPGLVAAEGVLTSRGGKTSHAAVVARGMGKPCVCGADELEVDPVRRRVVAPGGVVVEEGAVVSVDGTTGAVYLGEVPVVPSAVAEYFERGVLPPPGSGEEDGADELVRAVDRLVRHADRVRRVEVRANADTPEDAERARRMGARGIGLCRTEHMFLGERRKHVERLVLADTDAERERALADLLPLQRGDFVRILRAMDGLPVTIRLLDPPLHEFLPDLAELTARVAVAEALGEERAEDVRLLRAVRRLHEHNPMLGLRGVRLGLVLPGLYGMQVRAIAEAAVECASAGGDPRPQIMVPLVADATELALVREEVAAVLAEAGGALVRRLDVPVGTMIEVPRAALTADRIAAHADFFSFGTNDLTQMVWGFSRDDVESAFFPRYLELGVLADSPFETLDRVGVGELVRRAVRAGRSRRPDLEVGVCGEHGGDPASVHFFADVGLDYVSCSPFRVPVARLEVGRAALGG
ncbi:pyruvate phosphate dikinase [Streptoalloteichus tenebrarius]|uniref:Pyruvate, phosphate dikinase n=1 Tax=Streptoalloteichus tenebrarius (strain ATCC 17920 / DSM 40477 / JCM 4838 / CBS 697.72 / NBRC 16177 / NCIMB 11028 / NRRL B-12390 / A12253. 1 / ISP 5477) TaxID=1933 RepID=A0ABT1I409_STRSD|nr:pyruvate, phosphate dikinase [Streptoalloteichus tenebrarius]MCP2262502.1 pyruvate phosphate dikinase [Streptoalloteichus tenebrarius]BFE99660.1 pyruvate, phosphate dikinase [Streptoalloteichus tenebrarius]